MGHVLFGVYADAGGAPGARLGVTPTTIINSASGWQTVALTRPVAVTAGQKVWLSWVFERNPGVRYVAGTPARAQSTASWAGGMPITFGTASFANYKYSLYCTYTPGSAKEAGVESKGENGPLDVNSVYMDKEEVLIYPNPTDGNFTVTWKNRYSNRLDITIYNILGKAVKEVQADPDVNEIQLDLNGNSKGVYLFEMKDKKNDLILNRSRIIKSRRSDLIIVLNRISYSTKIRGFFLIFPIRKIKPISFGHNQLNLFEQINSGELKFFRNRILIKTTVF